MNTQQNNLEMWDLWYPKGAATGLSFARCLIDPQTTVLVHAAPEWLSVTVRTGGELTAEGTDLESTLDSPMTRLRIVGGKVEREDIWPTQEDIGCVVLLPGGEAGILKSWWHSDDQSEWRWDISFYNQK